MSAAEPSREGSTDDQSTGPSTVTTYVKKYVAVALASTVVLAAFGGQWVFRNWLDERFQSVDDSQKKSEEKLEERIRQLETKVDAGVDRLGSAYIEPMRSQIDCLRSESREAWSLDQTLYVNPKDARPWQYNEARSRAADACTKVQITTAYEIQQDGSLRQMYVGPRYEFDARYAGRKVIFDSEDTQLRDYLSIVRAVSVQLKLHPKEQEQLGSNLSNAYEKARYGESFVILRDSTSNNKPAQPTPKP